MNMIETASGMIQYPQIRLSNGMIIHAPAALAKDGNKRIRYQGTNSDALPIAKCAMDGRQVYVAPGGREFVLNGTKAIYCVGENTIYCVDAE